MSTIDVYIQEKKYDRKVILKDIDIRYPLGKIHAVLGANGSGKTTLFKCMMNYEGYKGGRVFPESASVGFLPADLYMYPYITGNEFIHFYLTAKGISYNKEEKEIYNNLFDLPLNDYAANYSTGMLKKLYLMALLLQHNEILLLDEPFNGLDYPSVLFITSILRELNKKGHTIFIASHIVEHLLSFSDTLSVLDNKTISYYDTKAAISKVYEELKEKAQQMLSTLQIPIR